MARLPIPGQDTDEWGEILNDYLGVEHDPDGTLRIRSDGTLGSLYAKPTTGVPKTDLAPSVQTSLGKADTAVQAVAGKTGPTVSLGTTDLADVTAATPADGDELIFDAGTSTWTSRPRPAVMLPAFSRPGLLSVTMGRSALPVDGTYQIVGVFARVGTAPAGADLVLDVRRNGTSIYTTTANRPTIPAGSVATGPGAAPDVTGLVAGDVLTVDILQVGSTTAGADLVVTISARRIA